MTKHQGTIVTGRAAAADPLGQDPVGPSIRIEGRIICLPTGAGNNFDVLPRAGARKRGVGVGGK